MNPTITPTDRTLGAYITDIDLANLSDSEWQIVEEAFHEFGILVFPQQHLSDEAQINFSLRFGKLEFATAQKRTNAVAVSNLKKDGSVSKAVDHQTQILRGNEGWHTDSSYMPLSAKASCLSAMKLPSEGGQTAWADMRAAYDSLDAQTKEQIKDLSAYHSLYYSQSVIGHHVKTGMGYGFHAKGAPIRPLIKVHPVTRRKSLYIGRHAYHIPGMSNVEARGLLDRLVGFACQPPRIYEHNWQVGDLCIWDNRCVLHRARPYNYSEVRVMRHTRVSGDPATELAPTAVDEYAYAVSTAAGG